MPDVILYTAAVILITILISPNHFGPSIIHPLSTSLSLSFSTQLVPRFHCLGPLSTLPPLSIPPVHTVSLRAHWEQAWWKGLEVEERTPPAVLFLTFLNLFISVVIVQGRWCCLT